MSIPSKDLATTPGPTAPAKAPNQHLRRNPPIAGEAEIDYFINALDELLATKLLATGAFREQGLLDLRLRSDTGVIGPEDPLRGSGGWALHPVVANQGVLHRAVERMTHMQRPGDIGGRDRDRVALAARVLSVGMEESAREPALEHTRLDLRRLEAGAILELFDALTHGA